MQISEPDFARQYSIFKEIRANGNFSEGSYFRSKEYSRMKEFDADIDNDDSLIYDICYDDLPLGKDFKARLVFARPYKLPTNARFKSLLYRIYLV